MARYYYGDFPYVSPPDPQSPVFFREGPFYNDVFYRRDCLDQHPVPSGSGGYVIPANEQILLRQEDPWGPNPEIPYYGYGYPYPYPVYVVEKEKEKPKKAVECTVELYAPQLYSDNCVHRVVEALKHIQGVRHVYADQWEKKVVVEGGESLKPEKVLRRLQRVSHMDRSVFWKDR